MMHLGSWQQSILREMLRYGQVTNPVRSLRGKASRYSGRYDQSFHSLLDKMRASGYTINRISGPRGGEWSAVYYIAGVPEGKEQ